MFIRKNRFLLQVILVATLVVLTASAGSRSQAAQTAPARIIYIANGTLGDKSFYDSAERGLQRADKELGTQHKTIQLGFDPNKWEAGLDDAISDEANYDILITGTYQMADFMTARADAHPTKKFIIFDTAVDYTKCKCANVYSLLYAQNESSYLGGLYAAAELKLGKLPNANGKLIIGTIGGLDIPVIEDFIVGYKQGAQAVDPAVQVLVDYVGGNGFGDPATAKEKALSMYDQGANIIFQIASASGQGVIEAGTERNLYVLGVDSDQALIVQDAHPDQAQHILTSVLKNIDNSLFVSLQRDKAGTLPYGTTGNLGLVDGGVGLAYNDIYNKFTPDPVKALVKQAQADIISGKIKVNTVFGPEVSATAAATMSATATK